MSHPGPASTDRIVGVTARSRPHNVVLPAGAGLLESLVKAAEELGVVAAQVELLGGTIDHMSWSVPLKCTDDTGRALVYSDSFTARGPVNVIGGSLTLGHRKNDPWFHCHAAWMDATGSLQAGHVWPGTTVGSQGLQIVIYPLRGVRSENVTDPETGMPVFTPFDPSAGIETVVADGGAGSRVILARALPGQDLQAAARRLCIEHGWEAATLRASLGSLVGPTFLRDGFESTLPAPCAELVMLLGRVSADGRTDTLIQVLVGDSGGGVHGGIIDPSRSPVAVTVELFLVEDIR